VCVDTERALLERLEGGCQVPIAAHATLVGDRLTLKALIAGVRGDRIIRDEVSGPRGGGTAIGRASAERLLARGGDAILREIYAEKG
jgi:hydroxymethylbilane synthase